MIYMIEYIINESYNNLYDSIIIIRYKLNE